MKQCLFLIIKWKNEIPQQQIMTSKRNLSNIYRIYITILLRAGFGFNITNN